jgi:hypothetical protein
MEALQKLAAIFKEATNNIQPYARDNPSSGWDFVMFDSNRRIGIHDRIFGEESIRIELDFVKPIIG